jgi:PTS system trehalose-specific IIC component
MMGKYTKDAEELLKLIGGQKNIGAVSHCMTRMRFVLNDPKKADIKAIEKMQVVKGTFTQAGQFQVIIGNTVADFYNDFIAVAHVEGVSKDQVKSAAKQNQNILQRMMTALAEIFAPLIPAIIVGGLILGFRNVIDSMQIFNGATLVSQSVFWAGADKFLWLIGEAIFHTGIPVGICWSVQKKMGGTPMLGIVLGLTLISGQLVNAYSVAGMAAADWAPDHVWDFGFTQVRMIGYQAQVLPAIMAAFCLAYLERLFRKITPAVVSMIVVPFCSLTLSVMAAHFILGPIGWKIGNVIAAVVQAGISGPVRVLFGAIFGFIYAPLVITGLHHMSNAVDLQLIAANEGTSHPGTMLWPMIALSNIAQGSAVLGMALLQKKDAKAQEINIPSLISCYLGVTEPAMFGVNLKYGFPFICGMIGSSLSAIVCTATSVSATAIGVGGLPGILSIVPRFIGQFAICMAIAFFVPILLTYIVGKKKGIDKEAEKAGLAFSMEQANVDQPQASLSNASYADAEDQKKVSSNGTAQASMKEAVDLKAPVDGKVISLKEINDGVFSSGAMGDGIGIIPESETVVSPAPAKVTALIEDSKHAVGLTLSNGMEILIHVGIDTVAMQGEGFNYLVHDGDLVDTGTPLMTFRKDTIQKAGHPDTLVMLVTEPNGITNIKMHSGISAKAGQTTVTDW